MTNLLDQFGKPLKREAPAKPRSGWTHPRLRAKYDSAQTTEENRRHWGNADGLSSVGANSLGVRRTLRNRSRYEYDNNGYMSGVVRQLANDHTGVGPTLQILSDDEGLNELVEAAWLAWCKASGFAEKLWTMTQAKVRDGEAFAILSTNPRQMNPVKLSLKPIEADMVTAPLGASFLDTIPYDGIEYDQYGNPTRYAVLRNHPGDTAAFTPLEFDWILAKFMIHWFRCDRPGQTRGVPELTAALNIYPQLRRWTLANLNAAEMAALFAALLETESPADGSDPPDPFESLEIERGMMTTLPAGAKMSQLKPEHPQQTYSDFKREVIAEGVRPTGMPINVATADSSRHNFSSAKLDHYGYRSGLRVDRSFGVSNVMEPAFLAWVEEAKGVPGLLPAGVDVASLPRAWYWPGWPSMDKDEAKNDTERLANNTTTLSETLAEWGMDWREVVRQRAREMKLMREVGLMPVESPAPPANPPQPMPAEPMPTAHAHNRLPSLNGNGVH